MTKIAESETASGFRNSVHPLQPQPRSPVQFLRARKKDAQEPPSLIDEKGRELDIDIHFPCHFFDYIASTSTGGLISITLGQLSMTVNEYLKSLRDTVNKASGSGPMKKLYFP